MRKSRLLGALCACLIFLQSNDSLAVAVDVVYVLQESDAMTAQAVGYEPRTWFDLGVEFLESATHSMVINESQANVGITLFADTARTELTLSNSAPTVGSTISGLSPVGGSSCISCGLQEGYSMLNNDGRSGAQKAVVLLSNGTPTSDPLSPVQIASLASDAWNSFGITTFVIALGDTLNMPLLEQVAHGGGGYPVYSVFESEAFNDEFSAFAPTVPIPPAVWLFGSGLLGLIGISRRKKAA